MKTLRCALLALTTALALAGHDASGSVPRNEDTPAGLFAVLDYVVAPAEPTSAQSAVALREAGVEQETIKARIVEAWFYRLRADPAVAVAVPGGMAGLESRLRDDAARERLIRSGIARLTPQDRMAYFTLLAKYMGRAARGDCQGMASVQDIAEHISIGSMSDADTAEYFSLLYRVVIRSVLAAPLTLPTPVAYERALRHLDDAVNAALAGDPQSVARLERVTNGGPGATMADICWASAVLMRSTAAMSGPDRDALLLYMLGEDAPVRSSAPEPAHAP
ncbi:hypothetical protein M3I54_08155 [Paraburkholderia sp. CNPSo 3274]|uniref:hypothetical protein n=1 Tax=Paraburkholderia sp. CNPSo 3274 TaxID=2940932 RepID=UPI0020B6715A|nr:hypothetical protein [Paraburkholderia sp. CNPSo 3274]MCP3706957.1 hypothetical protein [Paraburkholderia sp. CNPSo 3274]